MVETLPTLCTTLILILAWQSDSLELQVSVARCENCTSLLRAVNVTANQQWYSNHPPLCWETKHLDCRHLGFECCIVQLQQNLHSRLLWLADNLKAKWRKFLTNQLQKTTSLWETNHYWLNQKMPCILWNPKSHHHAHNSSPWGPYPEPYESSPQLPCVFMANFNIIHLSMPHFLNGLFLQVFPPNPYFSQFSCKCF